MENNLLEEIALEARSSSYFSKLYKKLLIQTANILFEKDVEKLSTKEINDLFRFSDLLSNSSKQDFRNLSYRIISLLDSVVEETDREKYLYMLNVILSKVGNFPSFSLIDEKNIPFERAVEKEIKKIIQKIPFSEDMYFTDSQYEIYSKFLLSKNFSFSGPTSLGKSFIFKTRIKQIISEVEDQNIVVLVPTRALITQFTIELKSDLRESGIEENKYKIFTNSKVLSTKKNNEAHIFILTPERLLSYLGNKEKNRIDYIFLDEAHKLSARSDARSIPFYLAIQTTMEVYPEVNLYFSSPNVKNPEIFLSAFNKEEINSFKTKESPVTQNLYFVDLVNDSVSIYDDNIETQNISSVNLSKDSLELILSLSQDKSSIIYSGSINKTINQALSFAKNVFKGKGLNEKEKLEIHKLIRMIREHIHEDYYLIDCLEQGVAFHFGNLPQLIRDKIEELFKKEIIKYLFCTSTLLEGVNMPAKNIFIFSDKKGKARLDKLDFWNLAGRAGRLTKDLSGNIICIKEDEKSWKDTSLLKKEEVDLQITAITRIERNIKKIEKILSEENISGTETEKEILEYLANLICIDTFELETNYKSPIINKLLEDNKETIILLAKKINEGLIVPKKNLRLDRLTKIRQQNTVYKHLLQHKNDPSKILLKTEINYQICKETLEYMYSLYNWEKYEYSNLKRKNSLDYYSYLMNSWINGIGLNQIIKFTLDYKKDNDSYVMHFVDGKPKREQFNIRNKAHVNIVINDLIKDIEGILRFKLEKYFNNYHIHLTSILGEEKSGLNWANLLEYGTRDTKVISLQNKGLSRQTALLVVRKYSHYMSEFEGDFQINKAMLLSALPQNSSEWDEVNKIL